MRAADFDEKVWRHAIRTMEFRTEQQEKYEFAEAYKRHVAQQTELSDEAREWLVGAVDEELGMLYATGKASRINMEAVNFIKNTKTP